MTRLNINGKNIEVEVDPATPLLWTLREQVGLTGTKYGCGVAQCGACTVHIAGRSVRSCVKKLATIADGDVQGGDKTSHWSAGVVLSVAA